MQCADLYDSFAINVEFTDKPRTSGYERKWKYMDKKVYHTRIAYAVHVLWIKWWIRTL